MIIVTDLPSLSHVPEPAIRQMIQQRIEAIASDEPYEAKLHGLFIYVQPIDSLEAIADAIGFDPTHRPWEILEEYPDCFDLLFIIDDSGYGVELFIGKTIDIPDLVALCKRFAVPGTTI